MHTTDRKNNRVIDSSLLGKGFRSVFGNALKELGYQPVKGNPCCIVRPVTDEIIHVITARHEYSTVPEHNAFDIYGTVATVYRPMITLTQKAFAKDHYCWFINSVRVITEADEYTGNDMERECLRAVARHAYCDKASVITAMENALLAAQDILLPELNAAADLRNCIRFILRYLPFTLPNDEQLSRWDHDEGLIIPDNYYEEDHREEHDRKTAKELDEIRRSYEERELDCWKDLLKLDNSYHTPMVLLETLKSKETMARIHNEMERRRSLNTARLRSYGIEI